MAPALKLASTAPGRARSLPATLSINPNAATTTHQKRTGRVPNAFWVTPPSNGSLLFIKSRLGCYSAPTRFMQRGRVQTDEQPRSPRPAVLGLLDCLAERGQLLLQGNGVNRARRQPLLAVLGQRSLKLICERLCFLEGGQGRTPASEASGGSARYSRLLDHSTGS